MASSHVLISSVIGHNTINIPEIFQVFMVLLFDCQLSMSVINVVMCVVHGTWFHMGSWRVDVEGTIAQMQDPKEFCDHNLYYVN